MGLYLALLVCLALAFPHDLPRGWIPGALPVTVECPDERLPAAVETAIWFVASEAPTNAAKHAEASRARVSVAVDAGRARVEVFDDGRGGADPAYGSGLAGLMERVAALGGAHTVADGPDGGTRLVAEFPCG